MSVGKTSVSVYVIRRNFGLFVSHGVQALVKRGWKIKYRVIAFFLSNISAKKLSKSFDVHRSHSKPKQCRLLSHSVYCSLYFAYSLAVVNSYLCFVLLCSSNFPLLLLLLFHILTLYGSIVTLIEQNYPTVRLFSGQRNVTKG